MRRKTGNEPKYGRKSIRPCDRKTVKQRDIPKKMSKGDPLFLDQTEARRAEKIFLTPVPPPLLSKGLDDRPPSYLKIWIRHCVATEANTN